MNRLSKLVFHKGLYFVIIILMTIGLAFGNAPKAQAGIPIPLIVTNLNDSGPGSLRYITDNAINGQTIIFADGLTGTIPLTRELYIQKSITIAGPGWDVIAVSGEGITNVIRIAKDTTVDISGLSIINGAASKYPGGGISNEGVLSLAGMMIDANNADTFGGGVYNSEIGVLTMFQTTVSNNEALGYVGAAGGGGIWNDGEMQLTYVRVLTNRAPVAGGGIYNDMTANLDMKWVWITGNSIYGLGQGYAWGAGLNNQADYISEPDIVGWVSMYMVTISDNSGTGYFTSGGGLSNMGSMSIQTSKIINNSVSGVGGGIDNEGAMEILQTTLSGNTAYGDFGDGGGIENSGSLTLLDTTVSGNTAYGVGGGVDKWVGEMWMWNTTVSGNIAYKSGGGIYNFGHPSEINNSTITNNTSDGNMDGTGEGGGIFNENEPDPTPKTGSTDIPIDSNNWLPTYVTLENTILAGNVDKGGEANDCFTEPWATVTSNGHNLIQDTTGCTIDGPATGDIYLVDAQLYPLANNGGPTQTHFPKITSPAVDTGNNDTCLPTDQRGAIRPQDGNNDTITVCDMGSVEGILGPSGNNWAPFANPQTIYTYEDNPINIMLTGADPEGDPITFAIVSTPTHGALSGTPPSVIYSPVLNYFGADSFVFKVTDSFGGVSSATVTINVLPVNDPPVVNAGPDKTVIEGFSVTLNGSYIDVDEVAPPYILWDFGDGTMVEGVLQPTHTYPAPGVYVATLYVVDSNGAVGMDTAIVTVEARAELSITKQASDNPALAGGPLTYTITVMNHGPSKATNVVVEDVLPTELIYVSASPGCNLVDESNLNLASPDLEGDQKIVCTIPEIAVGASAIIEIHTTIPLGVSGTIVNTAEVNGPEHDTDNTDNTVPVSTVIKGTTQFYCTTFTNGAGNEWSNTSTTTSPSGEKFLGEFSNENLALNLSDLPVHTQAFVTFDLYLIKSWDGNRIYWTGESIAKPNDLVVGPDHWKMTTSGKKLLDTTFSNWDTLKFTQAYTSDYPYGDFLARFGSSHNNTLGYAYSGQPMDSIYHMVLQLAHNLDALNLEFLASGLQEIEDESWGVDNVCVELSHGVDLVDHKIFVPLNFQTKP